MQSGFPRSETIASKGKDGFIEVPDDVEDEDFEILS
jgi:hypothetical protein